MTLKRGALGALVVLAAVFGIAWAKGDWSAAQSKAEDMKRKQMDLRKLAPEEIRGVVKAVCEANEEDRKDVGKDAAERVADKVKGELSNLERMRDDAYKAIDDVLADEELKSNHDSAKRLRDEIAERWTSIEKMARNAMRGGNHPIVSYMSLKGIEEHQRYQHDSSNCHAYEVETGSRRADCLRADGTPATSSSSSRTTRAPSARATSRPAIRRRTSTRSSRRWRRARGPRSCKS